MAQMATFTTPTGLTPKLGKTATIRSARHRVAVASTQSDEQPALYIGHTMGRRIALSAGLATVLLSASEPEASAKMVDKTIKAANMSSFQKKDLMADFMARCEAEFARVLTKEDAPGLLRLLILDAATYDAGTKSGGVNGSVALSDECPKELKGLVAKLQQARESIKKGGPAGQDMLSMADALVLGAKIATELSWDATKRASLSANNYELSKRYGSNFQVMRLGRIDASTADAETPRAGDDGVAGGGVCVHVQAGREGWGGIRAVRGQGAVLGETDLPVVDCVDGRRFRQRGGIRAAGGFCIVEGKV